MGSGFERRVEFGGQTLLLSHYEEIYEDFKAACDDVRLCRWWFDGADLDQAGDKRNEVLNPDEADEAVREALALVGYVAEVPVPVIRFTFGSKQPGLLEWDPDKLEGPGSVLHFHLRRQAGADLPPEFEESLVRRSQEATQRVQKAYFTAKQRVLEAGHGRSTPWMRWAMLTVIGIWLAAAGLILWLVLGSDAPLPAVLIAVVALATTGRAVQERVQKRHRDRHSRTWNHGPMRLRWTTRGAVREARWNSRRDLKSGLVGTLFGAVLAWLIPWIAGQ